MNTTKIDCEFCKNGVDKPTSEVVRSKKLGRPLFCSVSCGAKYYHKKRNTKLNNELNYNKNPNICQSCKCNIDYISRNNKFCSHSCSAKFNNIIVEKRKKKNLCCVCNIQIPRRGKYCSTSCRVKSQIKETENKIKRGEWVYVKQLKRYVIKLRGEKCEECGWGKIHSITGKSPIQLDHIDGNSENDSLDNLKLLCPNCHSLTPTFGNLNRGNGRKLRYKK